ncbi:MAG: hypothetical protein RL161_298 [Bacteroidota bacterium]
MYFRSCSLLNYTLACFFLATLFTACTPEQTFVAKDLTSAGLFSSNIEGPVWRDSCWFVVNFGKDGTIGTVNETGEASLFIELPAGSNANAIKFDSKGWMLLADWPMHNILRVHVPKRKVTVLVHDSTFHQPNDLDITSTDRIYASDPDWKNETGRIWMVEPSGQAIMAKDSMGTTNGITLDPSEKILYVNESVQRRIWAFDVNETGQLSGQRLFASFDDFGLDGMKCDRLGNLYVARHGKGTICIFSPDGKLVREIQLKGKKPSNLAFGGKDGKTCIVTMQDRGSIEFFRTDIPGKGF